MQVPANDSTAGADEESDEDWRWVKPLLEYAISNLEKAFQMRTNNVLKSRKHRVVKTPGIQTGFNRYSVPLGTRPAIDTPMGALKSLRVPEQAQAEMVDAQQWGANSIRKILCVMERK